MNFCPQCGIKFESNARFCAECGFNRTSVEPVSTLAQEVFITDMEIQVTEPAEETKPHTEITSVCPHCGTARSSGDRFCLECGFDISGSRDIKAEVPHEISQPVTEEISIKEITIEETVSTEVNKQLCPRCGSDMESDERFCQECGFDTKPDKTVSDDIKPETSKIPPDAEIKLSAEPVITQPAPETIRSATPIYYHTPQQTGPAIQPKGKKTWQRFALIIIGACILGAAGWFFYNNYLAPAKDTSANSTTKPMSLMDQELAKQKAKEQNQETQQNKTNQEEGKSDKVESAISKEKEIISKVILEVGQSETPKNKNPKNPTKLIISKPTKITRITTDHYNNGMGTPRGGNIIINDRYGITLGTYKAFGKKGVNGTPSAKWVAEPNVILAKGTYFISDSEVQTWSRTLLGSNGFIVVEGYEIE